MLPQELQQVQKGVEILRKVRMFVGPPLHAWMVQRLCNWQRQLEVGRDQSMVCQIPLPDRVKGDKLPIWEAASGS